MALPNKIDPSTPAGTESRSLGDDRIRALKQAIIDILGLPSNQDVSNAVFSIDLDGDITAIRLDGQVIKATYINATDLSNALHFLNLKGTRPGVRWVGTEVSAKDFRFIEESGALFIQENTGTEATPTWAKRIVIDSTGNISFASGTDYLVKFDHAITADRVVTFPDVTTTVVGTDNTQTITGKTIQQASLATCSVTDYLLLASAAGGTPVAHALYREGKITAWAVFNGASAVINLDGMAKFNISAITDHSAGLYLVTFSKAFAYASYPMLGSAKSKVGDSAHNAVFLASNVIGTSSAEIGIISLAGVYADNERITFVVVGGHQ